MTVWKSPSVWRLCMRGVLPCLLAVYIAGCGNYFGFVQKQRDLTREFSREQSARLLMELAPEDAYLFLGKLHFTREPDGPILIVAVTDRFKKGEIAALSPMQTPLDYYQIHLQEGVYELYFFADVDGNGYFESHEMVGKMPSPVTISRNKIKDGLSIIGPEFTIDPAKPVKTDLDVREKVRQHSYVYESLDDDFFDPKYGETGLYDPKTFMAHTQQYIFSFEKFDPHKTHVIFVHGFGGTPRDFKYLVAGLDRKRYQPWFYFYPSGMSLKKLGANLSNIIKYSKKNIRKHPLNMIIVAHSMGGLVSLATLSELHRSGIDLDLKGYVSFNSPYGGVDSAAAGLKYAPAVVPAWRDVATGSPFLMEMYEIAAYRDVPFYLFFGFNTGASSDGTITLHSQLDGRVHLAAYKSYGFNASHVGILNDEKVREIFYSVLSTLDRK
ncbi:MAG: alpha/beta hydrolase [Deltaproteobacteria bacterium]|nr:alpha/beta hydrolase [Deltaproteobacteria bacterium]